MEDNAAQGIFHSAEWYREYGKSLLDSEDPERRSTGVQSILKAYRMSDPEATYIVGKMLLRGQLRPGSKDPEEAALEALCRAANMGCVQARSLLNWYCIRRY